MTRKDRILGENWKWSRLASLRICVNSWGWFWNRHKHRGWRYHLAPTDKIPFCMHRSSFFTSVFFSRSLQGDYRTGKRLNMRKVIPYIASQFRKDRIWLRRTKPAQRNYQIVLAVDDSSRFIAFLFFLDCKMLTLLTRYIFSLIAWQTTVLKNWLLNRWR